MALDNKVTLSVKGIDCVNCATKIENRIRSLDGVKDVSIDFINEKMELNTDKKEDEIVKLVQNATNLVEDNVKVSSMNAQHHNEDHHHNIDNVENIKKLLIIGGLIYLFAIILPVNKYIKIILFVISYFIVGKDVLVSAYKNIRAGEFFDENFLMGIATIGAFLVGEYTEAVAVMLFYQVGELFQEMAVNKSRKSISDLMNIKPDFANLKVENEIKKVLPEEVNVNDLILVKPGEKVPLDGIIIEGTSTGDTAALTGESLPREFGVGDEILSGTVNNNGLLTIKVTKVFSDSTVSKILDLVQNASSKKSKTEKFITKFARYYTPIIVGVALLVATVPPFVLGNGTFYEWFYRALIFLVVSCPCALVISIPLGFFGGIGAASKNGILIKGGNYLEALDKVDTVIMDKTGTITKGTFKVVEINVKNDKISKEKLLEYVADVESFSNHPIAKSVVEEYEKNGQKVIKESIKKYDEISGYGISAELDDTNILVGNNKLMELEKIEYDFIESIGTTIYVAIDREYAGNIVIADQIKEDSVNAVKALKNQGISNIVMLTGDNRNIANDIAKKVGINEVYSELLPNEKVDKVEEIFAKKENKDGKVLFVGDGINDAPVLARADIGVAMGGVGSDAAIEAADVVIMTDELSKISDTIKIAKKTKKIVWQNIIFALSVKAIVLLLGILGLSTMWEAVFADVGVALIAVLNSTRVLNMKLEK
ncbi:MAG: heavy metal translocating P-type ATPase [Leptotrichiaceae bacterium]|jgi:Zn2+/Cd2+-exporting ATPase|nr:cadmium-translocating P-type ATPase [Leptotrichiaceae bacterium]MBP7025756.1 cadmium-translocating P-type ATPase [Leptotrichiaceae bacterium]MBP8637223.1 cadmium-translocating P-type ATPase [Leptotrichiaceae bacterium]MBP9539088.1 cadmium-translocating P-type ATPase [Leptotrichiaceae bacterium]